jgi:hypothetical protein
MAISFLGQPRRAEEYDSFPFFFSFRSWLYDGESAVKAKDVTCVRCAADSPGQEYQGEAQDRLARETRSQLVRYVVCQVMAASSYTSENDLPLVDVHSRCCSLSGRGARREDVYARSEGVDEEG